VFIGDQAYVENQLCAAVRAVIELVKRLQLQARVQAATDDFLAAAAHRKVSQTILRTKLELRATIPFSNDDIAVGSINDHLDTMVRAFNIKLCGGDRARSGCVGIGVERLAYALLCQHGVSSLSWPAPVAKLATYLS
jgi:hypothetical protein